MNKDNAHLYLPLVQALSEGKVIEVNYSSIKSNPDWRVQEELVFNYPPESYRVRPEPRRFWITEYKNGNRVVHNVEQNLHGIGYIKQIPVIEILDPKETP